MSNGDYTDADIDRSQSRLGATLGESVSTNLIVVEIPEETALALFSGSFEAAIMPLLAPIKRAVEHFQLNAPSVKSEEGRKEIASFAFKLAKSKNALEAAGKRVADDVKRLPKTIDANRKRAWDTIEKWQTEVRAPLTAWEEKEQHRKEGHISAISRIVMRGENTVGLRSSEIRTALVEAEDVYIGPECDEYREEYRIAKETAVERLRTALAAAEISEAQAAELARLRAAEAAREAKDREERLLAEAREQQRLAGERLAARQREEESLRQQAAHERELAEQRRQIEDANARAIAAELEAQRLKDESESRARHEAWIRAAAENERLQEQRDKQRLFDVERGAEDEMQKVLLESSDVISLTPVEARGLAQALRTAIKEGDITRIMFVDSGWPP